MHVHPALSVIDANSDWTEIMVYVPLCVCLSLKLTSDALDFLRTVKAEMGVGDRVDMRILCVRTCMAVYMCAE